MYITIHYINSHSSERRPTVILTHLNDNCRLKPLFFMWLYSGTLRTYFTAYVSPGFESFQITDKLFALIVSHLWNDGFKEVYHHLFYGTPRLLRDAQFVPGANPEGTSGGRGLGGEGVWGTEAAEA